MARERPDLAQPSRRDALFLLWVSLVRRPRLPPATAPTLQQRLYDWLHRCLPRQQLCPGTRLKVISRDNRNHSQRGKPECLFQGFCFCLRVTAFLTGTSVRRIVTSERNEVANSLEHSGYDCSSSKDQSSSANVRVCKCAAVYRVVAEALAKGQGVFFLQASQK